MSANDRRISALRNLSLSAESVRNLAVMAIQREIHNIFADRLMTVSELNDLQSEWNGIEDHLDSFINTLVGIRDIARDDAFTDSLNLAATGCRHDFDPEPHGARNPIDPRDLAPECPACGNSLPLDAECRCSGCGNG